ncbi:hypothetical protein [Streptomyces sp. NPDC059816]|uniref:hypothetical protein n=1 Tax=Streptomyces sp. NPDC059816 TaxID=3346960 RepID=UPI0036575DB1
MTGDETGPGSGHSVGPDGVGAWSLPDELACDRPHHPSITAPLEAVHRTLTAGQADAMDPDVPDLVRDCLLRDHPEAPFPDDALEDRRPVH